MITKRVKLGDVFNIINSYSDIARISLKREKRYSSLIGLNNWVIDSLRNLSDIEKNEIAEVTIYDVVGRIDSEREIRYKIDDFVEEYMYRKRELDNLKGKEKEEDIKEKLFEIENISDLRKIEIKEDMNYMNIKEIETDYANVSLQKGDISIIINNDREEILRKDEKGEYIYKKLLKDNLEVDEEALCNIYKNTNQVLPSFCSIKDNDKLNIEFKKDLGLL